MTESRNDECLAFGEAVREARKELGYSQDEFADVSELHRTYIGGIERGERNPTLTSVWRIATALELSPDELIRRSAAILKSRFRK